MVTKLLGRKIRQVLPTLFLYVDAAGESEKKSPVTYVDVDTVATALCNIVTISAPPLPLSGGRGLGVGGLGAH